MSFDWYLDAFASCGLPGRKFPRWKSRRFPMCCVEGLPIHAAKLDSNLESITAKSVPGNATHYKSTIIAVGSR